MKLRQASHLQQSAELVSTLHNVKIAYQQDRTAEQRLQNIGAFLGSDPTRLLERCEEYLTLASGIYLQLLPRFFRHPRNALLLLLEHISLSSTSQDQSLERAIAFVLRHQNARSDWINVDNQGGARADDWSFIGEQWWSLVTGTGNRTILPSRVHHRAVRHFSSGKRVEVGRPLFAFRRQVPRLPPTTGCLGPIRARSFCLRRSDWDSTEARPFVQSLQEKLIATSRNTDERFPQNECVRIENGEPILSPLGARHEPEDLKLVETWIQERMGRVDIIDARILRE